MFIGCASVWALTVTPALAVEMNRRQTLLGGLMSILSSPSPSTPTTASPITPSLEPTSTVNSDASLLKQYRSLIKQFRGPQVEQVYHYFNLNHRGFGTGRSFPYMRPKLINIPSLWNPYLKYKSGNEPPVEFPAATEDLIRNWADRNPQKSASIRPILNQLFTICDQYRARADEEMLTMKNGSNFSLSLGACYFSRESEGNWLTDTAMPAIEMAMRSPDQEDDLDWMKTFRDQLLEVEFELAEELGVNLNEIYLTIEEVLHPDQLAFAILDKKQNLQDKPLYSQRFVDSFVEKLARFAPSMAHTIQLQNRYFPWIGKERDKGYPGFPKGLARALSDRKWLNSPRGERFNECIIYHPDRLEIEEHHHLHFRSFFDQLSELPLEELSLEYIRGIQKIRDARARLALYDDSAFKTAMMQTLDWGEAAVKNELSNLPQRLRAEEEYEKLRVYGDTGDLIRNKMTAKTFMKQFAYSDLSEAIAEGMKWSQYLKAAGIALDSLEEKTQDSENSEKTESIENSNCEPLLIAGPQTETLPFGWELPDSPIRETELEPIPIQNKTHVP